MIFHQPCGHHNARSEPGVAGAETLCCMVSSCWFPGLTPGDSCQSLSGSVAKRLEIDFGAALVSLEVVVGRVVEQHRRAHDESVVERLRQIDLRALQIRIER